MSTRVCASVCTLLCALRFFSLGKYFGKCKGFCKKSKIWVTLYPKHRSNCPANKRKFRENKITLEEDGGPRGMLGMKPSSRQVTQDCIFVDFWAQANTHYKQAHGNWASQPNPPPEKVRYFLTFRSTGFKTSFSTLFLYRPTTFVRLVVIQDASLNYFSHTSLKHSWPRRPFGSATGPRGRISARLPHRPPNGALMGSPPPTPAAGLRPPAA